MRWRLEIATCSIEPGISESRGLARRIWAPNGQRKASGSSTPNKKPLSPRGLGGVAGEGGGGGRAGAPAGGWGARAPGPGFGRLLLRHRIIGIADRGGPVPPAPDQLG